MLSTGPVAVDAPCDNRLVKFRRRNLESLGELVVGNVGRDGPPPSFGPVAVRVVGFQLMGALPSVVDRCEVSER